MLSTVFLTNSCYFLFQKDYVGEIEEARMKLSRTNGKLKEEIQQLKKEKDELAGQLSIVEVCISSDILEHFICFHIDI